MGDLISRKAVEKIIKEFFKTKVDEIPKREKFNKLCDLCGLYLELNADLHKEIEGIPVAYDVDKVAEQLKEYERYVYDAVSDEDNYVIDADLYEIINCADCGKQITYGDCYTSLTIHTNTGTGYPVCEKCYKKEWEERRAVKDEYISSNNNNSTSVNSNN